jgi:hypothetical protein
MYVGLARRAWDAAGELVGNGIHVGSVQAALDRGTILRILPANGS